MKRIIPEDDGGRTRMGNTPTCETCGKAECVCEDTPAHLTGLKEQLGAAFPWLTSDEDDQISGADVIQQLQEFYDNLDDEAN